MDIAFVASRTGEARRSLASLKERYAHVPPGRADCIVALGGDGFMLATQHKYMGSGRPIYGMNRGTVGFLMNRYREGGLERRIGAASRNVIRPLVMDAEDAAGRRHRHKAINEVSLLRQSYQAANLRIAIDGQVRLESLIGDGVLVATPAGSTAYNLSAHGPILPLDAPLLALTPISPFRPGRWRGALVPSSSEIEIVVNEASKRPVNAVADHSEVKSVRRVVVREDPCDECVILFDPEHSWDERVLAEQFRH